MEPTNIGQIVLRSRFVGVLSRWVVFCYQHYARGPLPDDFDIKNMALVQAKTSRQLLDTILIPAVEEAIFNGEEDAKRLAQAFQKVNKSLIRLPESEKDLQDFQLLRTEGERVEIIAQYEEKAAFELKEADRNKQELVECSIKQVERVA